MERRRPAVLCLGLIMVAILGALEACDLGARDPHDPPSTQETLISLTDPDSTRRQLKVGFESGSITQYMNAFAADFMFHPDAQDSSDVFDNWNFDVERQVATAIFRNSDIRVVAFTNLDSIPDPMDPAVLQLEEHYDVTVDTTQYEGRAILLLRQANAEWRIFDWRDFREPGSLLSTWGILRGENR